MPQKIGRALAYAVLIWMIGFVWGSVVFMTPALMNIPAIPFVSWHPAISFPLLVLFPVVGYLLARSYLKNSAVLANEGLKLGVTFALVNFLLDVLVLVLLFKNGLSYFASLTVWLAYLLLIVVPWATGRSMSTAKVD